MNIGMDSGREFAEGVLRAHRISERSRLGAVTHEQTPKSPCGLGRPK